MRGDLWPDHGEGNHVPLRASVTGGGRFVVAWAFGGWGRFWWLEEGGLFGESMGSCGKGQGSPDESLDLEPRCVLRFGPESIEVTRLP